jgi:hypothetical protein
MTFDTAEWGSRIRSEEAQHFTWWDEVNLSCDFGGFGSFTGVRKLRTLDIP